MRDRLRYFMKLSPEQRKVLTAYESAKRSYVRATLKLKAMGIDKHGHIIDVKEPIDPDWIITLVNNRFKTDISKKNRNRNIAYPRHIARYLLRHHTSLSLTEIGQLTTGADHSTVCNSIKDVINWFDTQDPWAHHVTELENIIDPKTPQP